MGAAAADVHAAFDAVVDEAGDQRRRAQGAVGKFDRVDGLRMQVHEIALLGPVGVIERGEIFKLLATARPICLPRMGSTPLKIVVSRTLQRFVKPAEYIPSIRPATCGSTQPTSQ